MVSAGFSFDHLNTAPDSVATSTRGVQAWNALTEYFLSEGINRLDSLYDKFRRHQMPNEKALLYITDISNVATEIKINRSALDDDTIKRQLFRSLNDKHSSYVAQLRANQAQKSLDELIRELKSLCSIREESNQPVSGLADNSVAFFGSPADALGYQVPPQNQTGPAHADATEFLRHYLRNGHPDSIY